MILTQWRFWTICCVVIQGIIIFSAFYANRVNARRAPDDPEKKDFSPYAPFLAPFVLPPLVIVNVIILLVSSLAFGILLLLFPFALLLFRKPFLIKWLLKQAQRIGNKILMVDTMLLRAVGLYPAKIKLQYE